MKTHRMYRHQREETPNILILKPGLNRVPIELLMRQSWFRDAYKAPEQVGLMSDLEQDLLLRQVRSYSNLEVSHE